MAIKKFLVTINISGGDQTFENSTADRLLDAFPVSRGGALAVISDFREVPPDEEIAVANLKTELDELNQTLKEKDWLIKQLGHDVKRLLAGRPTYREEQVEHDKVAAKEDKRKLAAVRKIRAEARKKNKILGDKNV